MAQTGRSAGRHVRRPDEGEAADLLRGIAELHDEITALSRRIEEAESAFSSDWREETRKRLRLRRAAARRSDSR